mgnify:CR=1 FL=1
MQKLGFSPKICKIYTRQSVPTFENSRKMLLYELFTKIRVKCLFSQAFCKVAEFFFECFVKPRWFYDTNVRDILVD